MIIGNYDHYAQFYALHAFHALVYEENQKLAVK